MKKIKLAGLMILAILTTIFLFKTNLGGNITPPSENFPSKNDLASIKKEVNSSIEAFGVDEAYSHFENRYKKGHILDHIIEHFFGEYFYKNFGLLGIENCTDKFTNGCIHEIILSEVRINGKEAIEKVGNFCHSLDNSQETIKCLHGLGHSIMQLHTQDKLLSALELCKKFDKRSKPYGCTGGVFMEYFYPDISSTDPGASSKKFIDVENPYDQCLSLPIDLSKPCVYELVGWWDASLSHDYLKIIGFCQNIGKEALQHECFNSLGSVVAHNENYQIEKTISICNLSSKSSGKNSCKAGGAWMMLTSNKIDESKIVSVCENNAKCIDETLMLVENF